MIQKRYTTLNKTLAVVFASGLFLAGCSSSSNDSSTTDDTVVPNPDVMEVSITLDSTSTVPPANVDGAGGTGSFTVDTSTGAINGSVTVSGLTGPATAAHIHAGAAGEAGGVVVALEPNADSTTWSTPADATLDAPSIALFNEGRLYVNVHTEANAPGEVRAQLNDNGATNTETEISITLDSTSTVPPANVDGAGGTGSFTVDTSTGAINGSVTVSGLTGPATAAHIHAGAAGEAGGVVVALEPNADSTTWTTPAGATLDAPSIALFNEGSLYVNVHTEANAPGEVRAQLIDDSTAAPGTVTVSFRNTSSSQPITPPVVALHNAPGTDNGIRLFEVGQPAIGEVIEIAENGNNTPLADVVTGQIANGTVTAGGVAAPDPAGPLLPGGTSSITLDLTSADQVLSIVAMVVCTNDGFTGVDSRALSADSTETFTTPIYDAGSETNVLTLDYWVPPCSDGAGSPNLGDVEGGAITAHPGQSGSENPSFDFEAGSEFLEVTVTRN